MVDLVSLCLCLLLTLAQYTVLCQENEPPVEILPLVPIGFKVSIRATHLRFFGWRGNINHDFEEMDDGDIKKDLPRPVNGYFTFTNFKEQLKPGDIIYYWTYKIFDDGSNMMSGVEAFQVTEFFNRDGTRAQPSSSTSTPALTTTTPLPTTTTPLPTTTAPLPTTTASLPTTTAPLSTTTAPLPTTTTPLPTTTAPLPTTLTPLPTISTPTQASTPKRDRTELKNEIKECKLSDTEIRNSAKACEGGLIFEEGFDSTMLSDKWNAEVKIPLEPDFPYNYYTPDNGTLDTIGGSLVITPILTERIYSTQFLLTNTLDLGYRCIPEEVDQRDCVCEASGAQILPPVATAKITTKKTFSFKYGRIEVRAKMPSGYWLVPEINLEPMDPSVYGTRNYLSGLMRIAFVKGHDTFAKTLYGGPLLTGNEPFRSALLQQKTSTENWNKDFHNYTMVWKPDGINLLVDGEEYGSVIPGPGFYAIASSHKVERAGSWLRGTKMAPLDQLFYISLGLRVGGIHDFSDDIPGKPWRNGARKAVLNFWEQKTSWLPTWHDSDLRVDYVRVYAL